MIRPLRTERGFPNPQRPERGESWKARTPPTAPACCGSGEPRSEIDSAGRTWSQHGQAKALRVFLSIAAWCWLAVCSISFADEAPRVTTAPPRPQRLYEEAKARWQKETNSAQAAWEFGRACYDWADHATNDTQRAALGHEGIAACQRAIVLAPSNAPAHYYLGLNYGQLAQTKLLGALKLVDQMEATWTKTITLDPAFDYAGGHRALGILYRDAPGWPTSLGSKKKARLHLLKAVELAPDYPGNKLSLLESLAQWGEKKTVQDQAAATDAYLKAARARLTGDQWTLDWRDWDRQWDRIKAKCAVATARSPRG